MDIHIRIEKRHLVFLVFLVSVFFIIGVSAYVNPSTGVGHDANETGPGTFGAGDYVFPNNLNVTNVLTVTTMKLGTVPRTTWPLEIVPGNCVSGKAVVGINSTGGINCTLLPSGIVPGNCPSGKMIVGINSTGGIICQDAIIGSSWTGWSNTCIACSGSCPNVCGGSMGPSTCLVYETVFRYTSTTGILEKQRCCVTCGCTGNAAEC